MSFQTIGDQLETKLQELQPTYIGTIYNYDVKLDQSIKTPCIIISPADGEETILDTAMNETLIPYYVRLLDQTQDDKAVMEDNFRSLADRVMEKIKDMSYFTYTGGSVKRIDFRFGRGYTEGQEAFRVFELFVRFYCVESK